MRHLSKNAVQPFRWVEYSFSASCLFLTGLLINGVNDYYHAILSFAAMWTVMMLGLLQEMVAYYIMQIEWMHKSYSYDRTWTNGIKRAAQFFLPHAVGWVPYLVLWYESLDRFRLDMLHSPESPPKWVIAFYIFDFLVFSSFGFVQLIEMICLYRVSVPLEVRTVRPFGGGSSGRARPLLSASEKQVRNTNRVWLSASKHQVETDIFEWRGREIERIAYFAELAYTTLSLLAKTVSGGLMFGGLLASSSSAHYSQ